MPLWFIDTPSETEMVVNGTGTAPPAATPSRAASACGPSDIEHGVFSPCVLTMPTIGLPRSSSSRPGRAQEGAVRRAIEAVDGDARAVAALGAHGRKPRARAHTVIPNSTRCSQLRGHRAVRDAYAAAAHISVRMEIDTPGKE
jgi:hypothetical protein